MMMMMKPLLFCLFLLLFFFSFPGNISAVPLSRSLQLQNQEPVLLMGKEHQMVTREIRVMEEKLARMNFERDDYPGSGANNRHDPKSPGRG